MSELTPYLITAFGVLLLYGLKLIVSAIGKLMDKMEELQGELAAHNASTGERLASIETNVDAMQSNVKDIDQRVRSLEMRRA